ncbi:Pyrophosphate--fructose 6-phosphate 1-phosphotransferase [Poriferisphaera corsica]|uniref:ATP-dependent 6-phosphofructokinase n=1 Tax=Poriferisphaera corsica TaxID=2528020 RepID=A0A517YZF2_9BACT|nr:ATP-dependent 6-phosphofructokinase [Poriferisphaera corsica]QDU35620.1 Pyrophosphate--fructose 6-phosphate 1-phosphotransferase [Poriferisphaera corsica]
MSHIQAEHLKVQTLGPCKFDSPISDWLVKRAAFKPGIGVHDRMLYHDHLSSLTEYAVMDHERVPSFEIAGPRAKLFWKPKKVKAGIVTCGGLCPGLNDVIRGLVMVLHHRYNVTNIQGFRYGYEGLNPAFGHTPLQLTPQVVKDIHHDGGTILGSSRGPQDTEVMVNYLMDRGINVLFAIGGDGTQRGALALSQKAREMGKPISVIGIPKTIDNDVRFVEQSFGFQTAFTKAVEAIKAAHTEARSAQNGIGIIKLMGRHSGFIAAYAALAVNDANFVLIPEVDFPLEGENSILEALEKRLQRRDHAVIVVAEGAGQKYCSASAGTDKSGNQRLGDPGLFLKEKITNHFKSLNKPITVKYIDPSYMIRGCPATPHDSVLCFRLAAYAAHAAMSGRTEMVIGKWHGKFVHVPTQAAVSIRQQVNPFGDLWLSVIEATGQPRWEPAEDCALH